MQLEKAYHLLIAMESSENKGNPLGYGTGIILGLLAKVHACMKGQAGSWLDGQFVRVGMSEFETQPRKGRL
jgi:hypothetical protein